MGQAQQKPEKQEDSQTLEDVIKYITDRLKEYPQMFPETERKKHSQMFQQNMKDEFSCRVYGCLFGAIIGDALGAFCEFHNTNLPNELLEETMEMKGGGVFNLHKGQFTDDSELAYHLLKGLTTLETSLPLSAQTDQILLRISHEYVDWGNSKPFDMGITCKKGIEVLEISNIFEGNSKTKPKRDVYIQELLGKVKEVNSKSQSNGSLMRIAPMPIFFSLLKENPQSYRSFIQNEISLIHNNEVLREAGYIWVKVLYDLINRKNSDRQTFHQIFKQAERSARNEQVVKWFAQSKERTKISAVDNMGWAKIAWTYGMNMLYRLGSEYMADFSYINEIKSVIGQGGDSDTNAAIVGGLLGAIVGFRQLKPLYLSNLFKLEFPEKAHKKIDRPKKYEPINVLIQLLHLIETCQSYSPSTPNPPHL